MLKCNKAFTLVELIVVIMILAILATLWFVSYSSYTLSARDSARKSDLSILNNSIKTQSLKWFNISMLVDNSLIDNTWSGEFYYAGKKISWNTDYKAWGINYEYLPDISKPFLDPKTQTSYILWAYVSNYDLSATLEEGNISIILSSYKKRTSSWTISALTWTVNTFNNSITLLNIEDSVKFQIWDMIWTWSISSKEIVDIVWEKIYLDDVVWISSIDKIRLYKDDTSLIWNASNWEWTWIDCNNVSNLKENVCPIKENISLLVPYKIK